MNLFAICTPLQWCGATKRSAFFRGWNDTKKREEHEKGLSVVIWGGQDRLVLYHYLFRTQKEPNAATLSMGKALLPLQSCSIPAVHHEQKRVWHAFGTFSTQLAGGIRLVTRLCSWDTQLSSLPHQR